MRTLALPAAVLVLVVAACDGAPTAPPELAPSLDIVAAAVPGNDVISGATVITLPFSESLNTEEATTDAVDEQANLTCGAPATDASVWYAFTPDEDVQVIIDVSGSSYSAGVLVGVGEPRSLSTVSCGPGTVALFASASTTYYILAFDDQQDGGGNGGTLEISFSVPVFTTIDELTVDRFGSFDSHTGAATITGTFACSNGDFLDLFVNASQRAGRLIVSGDGAFFTSGACDGEPHPWSADVVSTNGRFAGGKALTIAVAFSCGPFTCADGYAEQTVTLRGAKGSRKGSS